METIHHFVINPIAGKRSAQKLIPEIERYMQSRGLPFFIYTTKAPGDAEQYVREICAQNKPVRFYVCGGDGTLSEAVNGAAYAQHAAVGVIPVGSGNDFVRNFDNPDPFFSFSAQVDGEAVPLDLIRINDRHALNIVNIGFDCDVVAEVERLRKTPFLRGPFSYLLGVFLVLARRMGQYLQVRLPDGSSFVGDYLLCTIGNGRYYGGGFCAAPKSCASDGLLELTLIKKVRRLRFLSLLPSYKKGTYLEDSRLSDILAAHRISSFSLRTDKPVGICFDGELSFFTTASVRCAPAAVRFIVPAGCTPLSGFLESNA